MRIAGLLLLAVVLQNSPSPPAPARVEGSLLPDPNVPQAPASIEGVVVEAGNGRPLPAATVRLQARSVAGLAGTYVTSTRDDGTFNFRNVAPGTYVLQAERGGYIPESHGTAPNPSALPLQQLTPGQKLSGIRLSLTRGAVISGRLIDDRGEAVVGAVVQALKTTYKEGLRERNPVQAAVSNDLGEYHLFMLRPGEYQISLVPGSNARGAVPFYYPGTIDAKAAQALDLREGEALEGINFSTIPTQTRRITGSVQGHGDDPIGVILAPVNGTTSVQQTLNPNEAAFQFTGVVPGSYMLVARNVSVRAGISLDVRNADMLNMRIAVGSGFRVPVRVRIEGHAPGDDPQLEKVYLQLRPETVVPGLDPETYSPFPDGRLTLDALAGDYRLEIVRPEGAYLKSVTLAGVDVLRQGLRLPGTTDGTMDVLVASDTGAIEGRTDGRNTTVVLVPDAPRRGQRSLFKSVKAGSGGEFAFPQVPPGFYTLFAWTEENGGPWLDPEYLRKYEDRGTPVQVEGNRKTLLDRPIPELRPILQ